MKLSEQIIVTVVFIVSFDAVFVLHTCARSSSTPVGQALGAQGRSFVIAPQKSHFLKFNMIAIGGRTMTIAAIASAMWPTDVRGPTQV